MVNEAQTLNSWIILDLTFKASNVPPYFSAMRSLSLSDLDHLNSPVITQTHLVNWLANLIA